MTNADRKSIAGGVRAQLVVRVDRVDVRPFGQDVVVTKLFGVPAGCIRGLRAIHLRATMALDELVMLRVPCHPGVGHFRSAVAKDSLSSLPLAASFV